MKRSLVLALFGSFALALVACGGSAAEGTLNGFSPATLDGAESVTRLSQASAPWMAFFAGFSVPTPHGNCPVIETNGNATTITGGCTDSDGTEYFGTAHFVSDQAAHTQEVTFDGYGTREQSQCTPTAGGDVVTYNSSTRFTGTTRASGVGSNDVSFHVDLRLEADGIESTHCTTRHQVIGALYDGTVVRSGSDMDGDGQLDTATYSGSGRFGTDTDGVVDARTDSEVRDTNVCSTEAASGSTTLTANGHTVVITYDGATDCSMDSTVTWTYDGADRGTLTGVNCSVGHPTRAHLAGWSVALVAMGIAIGARRRARRAR